MAPKAFLAGFLLFSGLASAVPQNWSPYQPNAPVCTDGGQLRCCAATFNGDNAPVELLTDLSCYDLTPATTNCILPGAGGLVGGLLGGGHGECPSYQCCQIVIDPIIGLYCGPPPGPCQGPEASPRCLDVLGGRFGHCPANPGTGREVASELYGNQAQRNPLGLDLSGLLGHRDVEKGEEKVEV